MKSSAVIGVPSDHTALGLSVKTIVWGLEPVWVALCSSWVLRTGASLLLMMKAWGQTMFMISWSTYSDAAVVLMLKPARFWSRAMVAVPPEDDDALVAAPLVAGVTATTDRLSAPAARPAHTDRLNNPFSPIALPFLSVAPVTADVPALPFTSQLSEDVRKSNAIATFFSVIASGNSARTRRGQSRSGAQERLAHDFCVGSPRGASD